MVLVRGVERVGKEAGIGGRGVGGDERIGRRGEGKW